MSLQAVRRPSIVPALGRADLVDERRRQVLKAHLTALVHHLYRRIYGSAEGVSGVRVRRATHTRRGFVGPRTLPPSLFSLRKSITIFCTCNGNVGCGIWGVRCGVT